jgi:hypothetical protein
MRFLGRETRGRRHIVFELGVPATIRHFDRVIAALENRGYKVTRTHAAKDTFPLQQRCISQEDHRRILARYAMLRRDGQGPLAYLLRCARDYILYQKPAFAESLITKERVLHHLELGLPGDGNVLGQRLLNLIQGRSMEAIDLLDQALLAIEETIEADADVLKTFRALQPDLLCVTPYVLTQYGQEEVVKCAKAMGIPVIFFVNSWDNLTTKGVVKIKPDATIVWNEVQVREAIELHGIPADRIFITGAPRFDAFFERRPEIDRETFCEKHRLDPGRPIIAYLGSSNMISSNEIDFVRIWIDGIRTAGAESLSKANIILRPHPKFTDGWNERYGKLPGVAVCASKILNDDSLLYHCLYHSRAVVGANTSAELEAAILHKPVFSIKDDSYFASGQKGTVHYRYLLQENGGVVQSSNSLEEHLMQLEAELKQGEIPARTKEFLQMFLRPCGLDVPAAESTADQIERLYERALI